MELHRPLADVTVVELGHIVAGPYCAMLLADLGADVIKVEHPTTGDNLRSSSREGKSMFNYVNRGKKSVTLDLKSADGQRLVRDIVRRADVVVENYSHGTAEALEVSYEDLDDINPDLVYCSIKGFGEGPYEDRPALDPVAEALSGLMSTTGHPGDPPTRCGTSIADMIASLHGALAVVGAIRQRDHTEEGQRILTPLFESMVGVMGGQLAFSGTFAESAAPMGAGGQPQWAPYDVFQTGDGRWTFIGVTTEAHWEALSGSLEGRLGNEDRYSSMAKRCANREQLRTDLAAVLEGMTRKELLGALDAEEIPIAPVYETDDVNVDPHLQATDSLVEIRTAEGPTKSIQVPGTPSRSSEYDPPELDNPPGLGEHTGEVLRSIGYSKERIEEFREQGVI